VAGLRFTHTFKKSVLARSSRTCISHYRVNSFAPTCKLQRSERFSVIILRETIALALSPEMMGRSLPCNEVNRKDKEALGRSRKWRNKLSSAKHVTKVSSDHDKKTARIIQEQNRSRWRQMRRRRRKKPKPRVNLCVTPEQRCFIHLTRKAALA